MSGDDDSTAPTIVATPPPVGPPVSSASLVAAMPNSAVLAGRYELLALLGAGGMGAVYRARDLELDELVALKVLRRELVAVPGILERFRQEVKLARKVTSPHVARTFDIGEHEGERFLTMELVDGESLADELQRHGRMPLARLLTIAADVCSGLGAAHAAAVVHRDLKPENVLLGKDGTIKITDFGIATAQVDVRKTQGVAGTPAYMAPEQVTADAKIDARADVYALGLMLYEMLTGDLPWKGDSAYAIASARLLAPPPDVRALRPDVPAALADLVLACMAQDRERRPDDARAVAQRLAELTVASTAAPRAPSVTQPLLVAATTRVKTIAVLPLRNRGAVDDEYLADGLTDDLIDSLSMVRGLRVRARGAVMPFKGADRDPHDLGRQLGVQVFVDGSVRRERDLLRVNVRLVSVDDAFQLWAKRFDRPASDVLAIGDEVASAIASALDVETAPKRGVERDPSLVDLYLRARHAYFTYGIAGTERAVALFEQALAVAPDDPLLLAGAAMAHLAFISMHPDMGEGFSKAVAVAERAVALAPELADGHIALANLRLHDGRDLEAVHEAKLAIGAAPSNPEAHLLLGRFFAESGATQQALAHLELAHTLDPRLNLAVAERARVHALLGDWDLADATISLAHPHEADSPFLYWGSFMRFLMWERNPVRTARVIASARQSNVVDRANIGGTIDLLEGRQASAHEHDIKRWFAQSTTKRRRAFFMQLQAELAGFEGLVETCLDAVVNAEQLGLTDLLWLDRCPSLDLVRTDARFLAARERVAARAGAILGAIAQRAR